MSEVQDSLLRDRDGHPGNSQVCLGDTTASILTSGEEIARYCACLFDPKDWVEVRLLPRKRSHWHLAGELYQQAKYFGKENQLGQNLYLGINPRKSVGGSQANDVSLARCLACDWDGGTTAEEARRRWQAVGLPEPTIQITSGHGIHAYWRLDEPLFDLTRWTHLQKALNAAVSSDPSIHDPPRIMRVPGFLNSKRTPYVPCSILDHDAARKYSLAELESILTPFLHSQPRAELAGAQNGGTTSSPEAVQRAHLYVSRVPNCKEGGRNNAAFKLAAKLIQDFGLGESDAGDLLRQWNQGNTPPLDEEEVQSILHNATRYAKDKPTGGLHGTVIDNDRSDSEPPPRLPFPVEVLPEPVQSFVVEAATAIGCDSSFVGLPVLASLARAIGASRCIRLKDTWVEFPIIWAVLVGPSGTHKSPALNEVTKLLNGYERTSSQSYELQMADHESQQQVYERDLREWNRSKCDTPPPTKPSEPIRDRFVVADTTIEALISILSNQPDGVLVVRDELAGWLDGMAEYKGGKGSDTGHWLSCWSASPMTTDRKTGTRKTIHVPRPLVSIVGGIQPGVLGRTLGREHMQDGTCARLLLTMPDPQVVQWSESEVKPETRDNVGHLFDRLIALKPVQGADGNDDPIALPLTPDAKTLWVNFYNRHRAEQQMLSEDLSSAWSKLEAYAARFALILQLVRNPNSLDIEAASMQSSIVLADWFGTEAKRVYIKLSEQDKDTTDEKTLQDNLIDWLTKHSSDGQGTTAREVQMGCRWLRGSGAAKEALQRLADEGRGQWVPSPPGQRGQPTKRFVLGAASTQMVVNSNAVIPDNNNETVDAGVDGPGTCDNITVDTLSVAKIGTNLDPNDNGISEMAEDEWGSV